MDVIEYDARLRCTSFPNNIPKDNSSLSRGHLDSSFDAVEAVRAKRVRRGPFDKFHVAKSSKFDDKILKCVSSLVDNEHVWVKVITKGQTICTQSSYRVEYRTLGS